MDAAVEAALVELRARLNSARQVGAHVLQVLGAYLQKIDEAEFALERLLAAKKGAQAG